MNGNYPTWDKFNEMNEKLVGIQERIAILETQTRRLISHVESETGTRTRMNKEYLEGLESLRNRMDEKFDRYYERQDEMHKENDRRLRKTDRAVYIGTGIVIAVAALLKFLA